jgi:phage N-6-adenine-methyltransferase
MTHKMPVQKPGKSVQEVETPLDFMQAVEKRFGRMDFDLAASPGNAKAFRYFHKEHDSLKQDWSKLDGNLWLNCEYSDIEPWAAKCASYKIGLFDNIRIFLLTPASVGSNWFQSHVWGSALVLALNPRLTFVGHTQAYPKDLILSCFNGKYGFEPWRWK